MKAILSITVIGILLLSMRSFQTASAEEFDLMIAVTVSETGQSASITVLDETFIKEVEVSGDNLDPDTSDLRVTKNCDDKVRTVTPTVFKKDGAASILPITVKVTDCQDTPTITTHTFAKAGELVKKKVFPGIDRKFFVSELVVKRPPESVSVTFTKAENVEGGKATLEANLTKEAVGESFTKVSTNGKVEEGKEFALVVMQIDPPDDLFEFQILIPAPAVIGGEILSIDVTSLLVVGAFANTYWIVPVLAVIVGAAIVAVRMRRNLS